MRNSVLVETSVVVGAAIFLAHEDKESPDPEHKHSCDLLELLKQRFDEKIGIITPTVEGEAFSVIEEATLRDFREHPYDFPFEEKSVALDRSSDRLAEVIKCLHKVRVNPREMWKTYPSVLKMYQSLRSEAERLSSFTSTKIKLVPPRYRKLMKGIYQHQDTKGNRQLLHLLDEYPSHNDRVILSEAHCLGELYSSEEPSRMYLASTDKHFSPKLFGDGTESRQVTDEISETFGVICEWPKRLIKKL